MQLFLTLILSIKCLIYMRRMPIPQFLCYILRFVFCCFLPSLSFIPPLYLHFLLYIFLSSSSTSSSWHGSSVPAGLWSGGLWVQPAVPEAPAAAPATDPSNAATLTLSTDRHLNTRLFALILSPCFMLMLIGHFIVQRFK